MKRLAEYFMSVEDYQAAANYLQSGLNKNPFLDDMNENLLQVYAKMGDRQLMVRHYQQFVQLLREELGIAPMDSTVKLYNRLCAGFVNDE
jgi:two-component system LytT family response regulator